MPDRPLNILFVCTANVCRSPLAAGLMAFNAQQYQLDVNVASGSLDHEIRDTHPTVVEMLGDRGVTLARSQSQPLTAPLVEGADLVLVMTADHAKGVVGRFPQVRERVFLLSHLTSKLAPIADETSVDEWLATIYAMPRDYSRDEQWDIQDPWKQPDTIFRAVDALIDNATAWLCTVVATL